MTRKQLRIGAGLVPTVLAAGALLAGPAATLGIGTSDLSSTTSSTTSDVTSATQQTVSTVQQTTQSVTTTVDTTTQTVQEAPAAVAPSTQSAPSAPAPSAPAAAPKTTTQQHTVAAAPKRTSTSAPTRSRTPQATRVLTTGSAQRSVSNTVTQAAAATGAVATHTKTARDTVTKLAAPVHTSGSGGSPLPCVDLANLIPQAPALGSLLQSVCDAGRILFPTGLSTTRDAGPLAALTNALATVVGDQQLLLHARTSGYAGGRKSVIGQVPAGTARNDSTGKGSASRVLGATAGGSSIRSGSVGYSTPGATSAGSASTSGGIDVAGIHFGGGILGGPIGTRLVKLVLLIDLAVIAAIALWKTARRLFAPRLRFTSSEGYQPSPS